MHETDDDIISEMQKSVEEESWKPLTHTYYQITTMRKYGRSERYGLCRDIVAISPDYPHGITLENAKQIAGPGGIVRLITQKIERVF